MSDTSGEDWLAMRLADVGKAWKEDVARLTSRIAELERAAETSRAEHAAALGLATARIRDLEGERDELLGLVGECRGRTSCATGSSGDPCKRHGESDVLCAECRRRARIEKATKGTT